MSVLGHNTNVRFFKIKAKKKKKFSLHRYLLSSTMLKENNVYLKSDLSMAYELSSITYYKSKHMNLLIFSCPEADVVNNLQSVGLSMP